MTVRPADAYYDDRLREFLVPDRALHGTRDAGGAIAEFFQSTYDAAADLGGWDRATLEPARRPETPPREARSTTVDGGGSTGR